MSADIWHACAVPLDSLDDFFYPTPVTLSYRCFLCFTEHVKEYLDLSSKAANDENKARNIKIVFEKQNSASAQTIAKLQVSAV